MSPRVIADFIQEQGLPPASFSAERHRKKPKNARAAAAFSPDVKGGSGQSRWLSAVSIDEAAVGGSRTFFGRAEDSPPRDDGRGGGGDVEDGDRSISFASPDFMDAYREARKKRAKDVNSPHASGRLDVRIWHSADAYSMGVILWQCLALARPFHGTTVREVWKAVQRGERPPVSAEDEARAPAGYVALMRELWAQDPATRPAFAETLSRLRRIARPIVKAAQMRNFLLSPPSFERSDSGSSPPPRDGSGAGGGGGGGHHRKASSRGLPPPRAGSPRMTRAMSQ